LGFSFWSDFMGETIGEAQSSCQQFLLLPNTPFTTFAAANVSAVRPVSRERNASLERSLLDWTDNAQKSTADLCDAALLSLNDMVGCGPRYWGDLMRRREGS
jgi:hypothetical protein